MGYRIRHVAIVTPNQADEVNFYKQSFGMQEVDGAEDGEAGTGVHLSDGKVELTILRERPDDDRPRGWFHIGFGMTDEDFKDLRALNKRMRDAGASSDVEYEPKYSALEYRVSDPDGNFIDLAPTRRWNYGPNFDRKGLGGMKRMRHFALVTMHQPEMVRFYTQAFGMYVVNRGKETGTSVHLSDGAMNLTVLAFPADDGTKQRGFHHAGFTFEEHEFVDRPGLDRKLRAAGASTPVELTTINAGKEYRVADPDGNDLDLAPLGRWNY